MKSWMGVTVLLVMAGALILLVVIPALAQGGGGEAQIPALINYQGYLEDSVGDPVNDTVSIVFSVYSGTSGGTAVWSEKHLSVEVTGGLFNVLLGDSGTPIYAAYLEDDRYLGVKVEDDSEMVPRQRITSAGYSLRADVANSAFSLDAPDGDPVDAVYVGADGDVGIGNLNPRNELHVGDRLILTEAAGSSWQLVNNAYYNAAWRYLTGDEANGISLADNGDIGFYTAVAGIADDPVDWGDPKLIVRQNGNVGIGKANPNTTLDVDGTIIATDYRVSGYGPVINSLGQWVGEDMAPDADWVVSGSGMYAAISGNVGIGTTSPQSALQVEGYLQLDVVSGTPPSVDCDEASERGRMKVDSAAGLCFICMDSGWVAK